MSIVDQLGKQHSVSDIKRCLSLAASLLINKDAVLNEMQVLGITSSLRGTDSFISAATSAGKATVFKGTLVLFDLLYNGFGKTRVPAHSRTKFVVIVNSPLVGLMEEMVDTFNNSVAARTLGLRAVHTHKVDAESNLMHSICDGNYGLIFTPPEVYTKPSHPLRQSLARLRNVVLVAIDEAHLVYQWGVKQGARAAFRGSFSKVGSSRAVFTGRTPPMTVLSASWTPTDRSSVPKLVGLRQFAKFDGSAERFNIRINVQEIEAGSDYAVCDFVQTWMRRFRECKQGVDMDKTVVFSNNFALLTHLNAYISSQLGLIGPPDANFPVRLFLGTMEEEKSQIIAEFQRVGSRIRLLLCTSAFGMGMDVPDIRICTVIMCPRSLAEFYQWLGRAGRDGQFAFCWLLYQRGELFGIDEDMRSFLDIDDTVSKTCHWDKLIQYFSPTAAKITDRHAMTCCCWCESQLIRAEKLKRAAGAGAVSPSSQSPSPRLPLVPVFQTDTPGASTVFKRTRALLTPSPSTPSSAVLDEQTEAKRQSVGTFFSREVPSPVASPSLSDSPAMRRLETEFNDL